MINKQLTNFIKEQLEKGADKDIISRDLLANNWTKQDIEEGFKSIDILDKNTSSLPSFNMQSNHLDTSVAESDSIAFKVALTVLGLFLLAGGAFGYLFRNDIPLIKNLTKSKDVPINEIQNLEKESQIKQEDTTKEEPIISEPNKEIDLTAKDEEEKDVIIDNIGLEDEVIIENIAQ